MFDNRPIGLIDSGIGGFTVLKEVQRQLPEENIIYLGDSYRMPYGECDNDHIIHYANSDIRFLQDRGVKAILLACNTVSSLADQLTAKVPLFSIVEAGCLATMEQVLSTVCSENSFQDVISVGLIATRATVRNGIYPKTLAKSTDRVRFIQHGTATLASVINNYPGEIELLKVHIRNAIDPLIHQASVDTLLLGCTHYPIVRESIETMYPRLTIINPAVKQIGILADYLNAHHCAAPKEQGSSHTAVYTTGTLADQKIFESMLGYLDIRFDVLKRSRLDID